MNQTRTTRLTALAAVAGLVLTACSKGSSSSGGGDTPADGTATLEMWTHNAGNEAELGAIQQIVDAFNASQTQYRVDLQAFPQDSYNQSVTAAAASNNLPCILDVDAPNVPNWAWAGYLAPLEGMDDILANYLPSTVGKYDDQTYSFGYYDVSLTLISLQSVLDKYGIRIPTMEQPWTGDEFNAALRTIKDGGEFEYAFDFGTGATGEWWPYAYSPILQSFGGDLINRENYESAEGVLNGPEAVEWATWFRSLAVDGYMPLKSGPDPAADFANGKSAILWSGQWSASNLEETFGDDVLFLPPVDFGHGPKVGGGSWQWAVSSGCDDLDGALEYMKFSAADEYVALVSEATFNIPATDAAAEQVAGYEQGGDYDIFRQYSAEYAMIRPPTPGYPFIATEFTKTAQDILNGADPQAALDSAVSNIDANQAQFN